MSTRAFEFTALAFTLLLASLSIGCSARTVVTQRTIDQVALVPAPSGPHSTGVPMREGKVALEGGLSVNQVNEGGMRSDGQSGHVVVANAGRGRVVFGANENIEVGFSAEYHGLEFAQPIANDTNPDELVDEDVWRIGTQLRFHGGDANVRIGGLFELEFAEVPYTRYIEETNTVHYYDDNYVGDDPDGNPIYERENVDVVEHPTTTETQTNVALVPYVRLGFFVSTRLSERFAFTGGALLQNQPVFFGSRRQDGVCYYERGELVSDDCQGTKDADDVAPYRNKGIGTLFGALSVDLSPITLIAQFYGHVVGDAKIIDATPYGGELILRFSL